MLQKGLTDKTMYRIDCDGLKTAARIMYRFMTNTSLVRPECTMWNGNGAPCTIVNNGDPFMTEKDMFRKIIKAASSTISCVASTDLADTRRVVLTYAPGLDFMVLNFPQANGRLTVVERKIIEDIGSAQ